MTLKNGYKVLVSATTIHDSVPETKKPIRCEFSALFVFKPLSPTQTEITHVGYFNPRMKLPGFVKKKIVDSQIDEFLKRKKYLEG